MKLIKLCIIIFLLNLSIVLAAPVLLVADDDSPATDVVKLTALALHLEGLGHTTDVKLNSVVTKSMATSQVTVFMYFGNTLIVGEQSELTNTISDFLLSEYGINAELSETVVKDDLRHEVTCTNCDPSLSQIISDMVDPLVIAPSADVQAADLVKQGAKSPDEITATEVLNRPLIILGGPCANEYWEIYSSETCQSWPNQKLIKLAKNGNENVILIAGTTMEDTLDMAQKIAANYYVFEDNVIILVI